MWSMSTITSPVEAPASRPDGPRNTWRTSSGNPTMAQDMSEAAATSAGVSAHTAPRSISPRAFDLVRVVTVTRYPASRTWPHMAAPITPVPTHPIPGLRVIPLSFMYSVVCLRNGSVAGVGSGPPRPVADGDHVVPLLITSLPW